MKVYIVTDWEFKYNNIYTTKEEVYNRIFGEDEEDFDVKEKMEEVSWEELIDEYEDGEITVEEYNINLTISSVVVV